MIELASTVGALLRTNRGHLPADGLPRRVAGWGKNPGTRMATNAVARFKTVLQQGVIRGNLSFYTTKPVYSAAAEFVDSYDSFVFLFMNQSPNMAF
jgi:hypothetical protein